VSGGFESGAALGTIPSIDYANHPAYGRMFEPDADLGARAETELQPLISAASAAQQGRAHRLATRSEGGDGLARQVAREAYARLETDGPDFEGLAQAAAPLVERTRERVSGARDSGEAVTARLAKYWLKHDEHQPVWTAAHRLLQGAGVMKAVTDYFGADGAKLRVLTVVVNRPGQSWNTNLFPDADVETPPTAGFHIDSDSACVLKTVIYLDDVGSDQGPFGVVPTSHHWDQTGPGRGRRRGHARSSFGARHPDHRRMFVSLPPPLQVKAAFGGDMLAASPESRALLDAEMRLTGPRGQINLFDPEAIHRGGLVEAGERVVVIAGIRAVWKSSEAAGP
jgi:hypothetical protein